MAKVAAYILHNNGLAERVVPQLVQGVKAAGDRVDVYGDAQYRPDHPERYDAAIFWGFVLTCQAIMAGYNEAGKAAVYLDLAYWKRDTYYKVSVGARHPTAYFQKVKHGSARREKFGIKPEPYRRDGQHILIAGLSTKAAWAEKEGPLGDYERNLVAQLQQYTKREIIYRPKTPSAAPIPGAGFSTIRAPLVPLLQNSWAVVSRHSNVVVDGLVLGVPAFSWYGVGSVMSLQDLSKIETPWYPEDREQFLNDVAYCQWSTKELQNGTAWRHLKDEGLVRG